MLGSFAPIRSLCWILAGIFLVGCAGHRVETTDPTLPRPLTSATPPAPPIQSESFRVSAELDAALGVRVWNAELLFQEGEALYDADRYDAAIKLFQRVVEEFPDSRFVAPSLLLLGACEAERKLYGPAVSWYQRYLTMYPAGTQRWYAWRGLGDIHATQEDWASSEQDFRALMALPGTPEEQADAARARLARALVEQGKYQEALPMLEDVLRRHQPTSLESDGLVDASDTGPLVRFYLGEVARRQAEDISLSTALDLTRAESDLERKAALTLEAHRHYFRTFSYGSSLWTAAAAYRMGYIYERFYQDLLAAPMPEGLSPEDQELYREAMEDQLKNVVKKAYDLYGQVVRYARTLNLDEEYVNRCREGIARLETRVNPARASTSSGQTQDSSRSGSPSPAVAPQDAGAPRARL